MKDKQINWWKIIAIIFITLFILENIIIGLLVKDVYDEQELTMECYYEICGDYADASFEDYLCSCYDYDIIGNLMVVEQEYMK